MKENSIKTNDETFETIQNKFLTYLKEERYENLEILIKDQIFIDEINHIYTIGHFTDKKYNAFQVICVELFDKFWPYELTTDSHNTGDQVLEFAMQLLDEGIDIRYRDPHSKYEAIEFACLTGHPILVGYTIERYKNDEVTLNNRPLIPMIIYYNRKLRDPSHNYLEVIEILLNNNVDANVFDLTTGEPPIYIAAKFKLKDHIELLIRKAAYYLDLDMYEDKKGKTARQIIIKYNLYEGTLPNEYTNNYYSLYRSMHSHDVSEFITEYQIYKNDLTLENEIFILYRAVNFGIADVVEYLLNHIPNDEIDLTWFLEVTCRRGYYQVLKVFLSETKVSYNIELIEDIVGFDPSVDDIKKHISVNKCLQILLKRTKLNLNKLNTRNESLLEIAIRQRKDDIILTLLNNGANLIKYDVSYIKKKSFIAKIDPTVLKTHFDSCISMKTINDKVSKLKTNSLQQGRYSNYYIDMTSLLPYQNSEDSFMPQLRFSRGAKNKSLSFKTSYKIVEYINEMTVFKHIASNPKYSHLLIHPLTSVFIALKWEKVKWFYITDFMIFVAFALVLNVYIFKPNRITICLLLLVLLFAEFWHFFEMFVHGFSYLKGFEGCYRTLLFILTTVLLATHSYAFGALSKEERIWRKYVGAFTAWVSLTNILLLHRFIPALSNRIIMMKDVQITTFKVMSMYFILIVAFGTCFYTYLQRHGVFFDRYFFAIYKTFLLTMGEYDFNNPAFEYKRYLTNGICVFLITFIYWGLLNLLAALSVSNLRDIKNQAAINSSYVMINNISKIESTFMNSRLSSLMTFGKYICLFSLKSEDRVIIMIGARRLRWFNPKQFSNTFDGSREIIKALNEMFKRKGGSF